MLHAFPCLLPLSRSPWLFGQQRRRLSLSSRASSLLTVGVGVGVGVGVQL